ncbi:MAG: phosphopantetheine-binding protein [Bacteroidota bacterium]
MSKTAEELKLEIKELIMHTLAITDVNPEDVDDEKPLFGGDNALTLDSVDAIEIIMAIQRTYGIRIADQNLARQVISSINSIAGFIKEQQSNATT